MKFITALVSVLIFCSQAMAETKTKTFRANPDLVFKSALKVAQQKFEVKYSDKEARTLSFERPVGVASAEFSGTITVEPFGSGGSIVTFQFRSPALILGRTHYKRFFEELAAELGESEVKTKKPKSQNRE
jgi:hypothetical protein